MTKLTMKSAYTIYKLCKKKDIELTNLKLNKILYFSQIIALGKYNISLMDSEFRATDIGPVDNDLYILLKAYGGNQIRDVFPNSYFKEDDKEYNILNNVIDVLGKRSSRELVNITKDSCSVYFRIYSSYSYEAPFGLIITNKDLLEEYNCRKEIKYG